MGFKRGLGIGVLSISLLTTAVLPVTASPKSPQVENQRPSLAEVKKQLKYSNKKAGDGNSYTEATYTVNGIESTIILDPGQKVTDSMVTENLDYIEQVVNGVEPDGKVIEEPSIGEIGTEGPVSDGDGYLLGRRFDSLSASSAKSMTTSYKVFLTGVATAAGFTLGPVGASSAAAVATAAGEYINFSPSYTQTRYWNSWSSTKRAYLVDMYVTHYTSSSYATPKKVTARYDILRTSYVIGP